MKIAYDILCTISFKHAYFSRQGNCLFDIVPAAKSAAEMRQLGLTYKLQQDGFALLYDCYHAGKTRLKPDILGLSTNLQFFIINKDPLLLTYTSGLEDYKPGSSVLSFTIDQHREDNRLHTKKYVSKDDLCTYTEAGIIPDFRQVPFGVISLPLNKVTSSLYYISFGARATYWRYVLASDYVMNLQQPAILDKDNEVVFTGPFPLTLPDKKEAVAFVSDKQINMNEQPGKNFRLIENYNPENGKYKIIVQRLPYPDKSHLSAIGKTSEKERYTDYSNIII
jgi:hypothetical protein